MLAGELYDAFDPELVALRVRARELCRDLNASAASDAEHRRALLLDLFGAGGDTALVEPPFHCDYGANIRLGASRSTDGRWRSAPTSGSAPAR